MSVNCQEQQMGNISNLLYDTTICNFGSTPDTATSDIVFFANENCLMPNWMAEAMNPTNNNNNNNNHGNLPNVGAIPNPANNICSPRVSKRHSSIGAIGG